MLQKIHFVIDKSGSMANMMEDVKVGIRETLSGIDECDVSVSTFNDEVKIDESVSKSSSFIMPELSCRGGTRLYDCLEQVLSKEMDSTNTMVVVLTDGINNSGSSTEENVRKLMLKFKENNNIMKFLGANMDALLNAAVLGVDASDALTYDGENVRNAFRAVSENLSEYQQSGVNVPFLPLQRAASIATPPPTHTLTPDCDPPKVRRCNTNIR